MVLVSLHAINVSVQYNSGLLPDIMTPCDYIGEPFLYREEFLSLQPNVPTY